MNPTALPYHLVGARAGRSPERRIPMHYQPDAWRVRVSAAGAACPRRSYTVPGRRTAMEWMDAAEHLLTGLVVAAVWVGVTWAAGR
jgi:hypothetical protein